jgi:hypothetical protein
MHLLTTLKKTAITKKASPSKIANMAADFLQVIEFVLMLMIML